MLERPVKLTSISPARYREAMSHFAGAVHVATTDGPAGRRGLTVSAAVSVSDDPATVMICLNRNREENRMFEANGCFALNTLCVHQIELARAFAGEEHLPMDARFAFGTWQTLETGAPVLTKARMSIDCVLRDVQLVHTHYILFGEVVACGPDSKDPALVYLDRDYRSV